jgi:LysR family glycine cleavage system transcriptional activator
MKPCSPPPRPANETLEIHSSPTFASHWLARNLGSFQLENPGIAVRLLGSARSPISRDSSRSRHPLGRWSLARPRVPAARPLFTYAPMLSPALAASIGGINQPSDLLKLPIIGAQQDTGSNLVRHP